MYLYNQYLVECIFVVLAVCVFPPRQCMILGRHRVHPFGHTAHMRYPSRQRDYSKGSFLSQFDSQDAKKDKEPMLTDDPSAYGGQRDSDDTLVYYKNSYGAHMGDIFKNNFKYHKSKYSDAHIEEPYIEVYHKPSLSTTAKKKNRKKSSKKNDYPEMPTVDFQRVRKVLKKEELMVSILKHYIFEDQF